MSKGAVSVFVFGIYLGVLGIGLLFMPNVVLPIFGFAATGEEWIRVLGVLVVLLAYYYIVMARSESVVFFRATVVGRLFVLAAFVVLVVLNYSQAMLIGFGVVDGLGALWTQLSLGKAVGIQGKTDKQYK